MSAIDKLDDVDILTLPYVSQLAYNAASPAEQVRWRQNRFRAKHDHIFLGTDVLEMDFQENPHRLLFEQFLPKKPGTNTALFDLDLQTKKRMILWPRGLYKALDCTTEIPTPSGFRPIKDIHIGDWVFDERGQKCKVTGESPVYYNRPCCEIEFSTGDMVVCDEDHLWLTDAHTDMRHRAGSGTYHPDTQKTTGRRKERRPSVKTTKQISQTLCYGNRNHNHSVVVAAAAKYPEKTFTIHPYVLGAWLGDGTSSKPEITIGPEDQTALVQNLTRYETVEFLRDKKGTATYRLGGRDKECLFFTRLRRLELIDNKHIPDPYLRGSISQRLSLLRGLMDTDGCAFEDGLCSFGGTNRRLVDGVRELVASLGFKPGEIHTYAAYVGRADNKRGDCAPVHTFTFTAYRNTPVFDLERKSQRQASEPKSRGLQKNRMIVAVRSVPSRPVKCIMVASPSRLYLVGRSYIPTHNTTASRVEMVQLILNYPNIRICFLTGGDQLAKRQLAALKRVFERPTSGFKRLFPEFCGTKCTLDTKTNKWVEKDIKLGNAHEFTIPCRTNTTFAEPTFVISTAKSVKAGSHFDVIFIDDLVTEQNYRSVQRLEQCYQDYLDICPLLDPAGFIIMTGTRYSFGDTYERIQETAKIEEKKFGRSIWKFSIRDCWSLGCRNCDHPQDGCATDVYHDKTTNIMEPPCTKCKCRGFEPNGIKGVLFPVARAKDGHSIGHTLEFLEGERIRLGAEFFACFPAESKVLRADWSETSIENLNVGDEIIGFDKGLIRATVQHVHVERAQVIKVTTENGRIILCTPDHKFLRIPNGDRKYLPLKIGSRIVSVYRPQPIPTSSEQRDLDWLGGILDGEGSGGKGKTTIAQSRTQNPETYQKIENVLRRLKIDFGLGLNNENRLHRRTDIFELRGGRSLKMRLLRDCQMAKKERFIRDLWSSSRQIAEASGRRGGFSSYDRVVSLESVGLHTVYNIQSSSGNFVCQGYAVKNCQYENSPLSEGSQTFTESLLGAQTLHHPNQIPPFEQSYSFIVGDLAYVGQEGRDFSVLFMCRLFKGQIFVHDCAFDNWDSGALAKNLVSALLKHRPAVMYLEKFNGWEAYDTIITAYAAALGVQKMPIVWLKGSQAPKAKLTRIGAVKGVLQSKRLWLYSAVPGYDQLVQQLLKWPKLGRHDDFADTLGMVVAVPSGYQLENPPVVTSATNWLRKLSSEQPIDDSYPDCGMGSGLVG